MSSNMEKQLSSGNGDHNEQPDSTADKAASEQPAEEPSSSDPASGPVTAAASESASEQPPEEPVSGRTTKNPAAVALGRLGGLKGGKARAQKLTAGERSEAARKAANARWRKTKPSK